MLQFLPFLEAKPFHDLGHPISGAKIPHEIIFKAHIKTRAARITLPRATSAELPIDPARFVALGADNKKPAPVRNSLPELNVRAAARHVGRNGNSTGLSRALDDLRFLHVELR